VPVPAVIAQGDFAIMGVNSNITCIGGGAGDDEISFVCFQDITTGTTIDFTDNGWQRVNANQWGNTEGFYRITRTGATITAGTVITIRLYGVAPFFAGILPDNSWSLDIKTGSAILNSNGDQIFFMQGGVWNNGTFGNHDATYTGGSILFGFNTFSSWDDFGASTQKSGLIGGMDCFSMMPSGGTDFLKYTGDQTAATQIEWIGRINDNTNWTSYAGATTTDKCNNYYAGLPNYELGHTIIISSTGIDVTYNWYGNKNTEWFDCANWGPLRVPTASTSVVIPNDANVDNDIVLIAGENAECRDFTISHPTYAIRGEGNATKLLTVNRHFVINAGTVDFNDGNNATDDGIIYIAGSWYNYANTTDFDRGNSSVILNGTGTHFITSNQGVENFYDITIVSPSVLDVVTNDLQISGDWVNYNQSGFIEGAGNVEFDGTANQAITTTGGEIFYDMEVDNPTSVTLQNNVTVSNELIQTNGELIINGKILTLQSDLSRTSGTFTGSNSSTLIVNGTGNLATSLYFTGGSESLSNLTINRSASGTVTLATNLTVYTALTMTSGELDINDNLLTLNGTISGIGTLKGSANSEMVIGGSGNFGTMYFSLGSQELENLTTNRTSGISTLGTDLTVNTQLTLTNGLITTGVNTLIVSDATTSSIQNHNVNSYINGNLRRNVNATGSYDLPVGTSAQYEDANITLNSSTGISYFDAYFTNPHVTAIDITLLGLSVGGTPVTTLLDYGFWTISPDAYTSIDYDVTIVSRGHTNGGAIATQHTVVKRIDSANDWDVYPSNHNNATQSGSGAAAITAKLTNLTAFSDFAIARSDNFPLPIELVVFKAKPRDNFVELIWITESETNNDYFQVERSEDGIDFNEIINYAGAGNSNSQIFYNVFDNNPINGINYYRLKQVDYDGKYTYSDIIAVDMKESDTDNFILAITIYNNTIDINLNYPQKTLLQLIDITGKSICTTTQYDKHISMGIAHLSKGIYFIRISSDKEMFNHKFYK